MIMKTVIAIFVLIAGLLIFTALKPADFRIERSISIVAPPAIIFPYMNNPRKFEVWNPFTKNISVVKVGFTGPDEGVSAKATWDSDQAGSGTSEITESVEDQKVFVRLDFVKPFKGTQFAEYTVHAEPNGTSTVKWVMTGKSAFIPRLICNFTSMDKMLGGQLEKGLALLKTAAETDAIKQK